MVPQKVAQLQVSYTIIHDGPKNNGRDLPLSADHTTRSRMVLKCSTSLLVLGLICALRLNEDLDLQVSIERTDKYRWPLLVNRQSRKLIRYEGLESSQQSTDQASVPIGCEFPYQRQVSCYAMDLNICLEIWTVGSEERRTSNSWNANL